MYTRVENLIVGHRTRTSLSSSVLYEREIYRISKIQAKPHTLHHSLPAIRKTKLTNMKFRITIGGNTEWGRKKIILKENDKVNNEAQRVCRPKMIS